MRTTIGLLTVGFLAAAASAQTSSPAAPSAGNQAMAASPSASSITTIAGIVAHLKDNGFEMAPAQLREGGREHILAEAGIYFAQAELWQSTASQDGAVIIVRFNNAKSTQRVATTRLPDEMPYATWDNFLFIQACSDEDWADFRASFSLDKAVFATAPVQDEAKATKTRATDAQIQVTSQTLSMQLELFKMKHGSLPSLVNDQWKQLLAGGFLPQPPANPLSPQAVASKIVPGVCGSDVDPATAGWVFNAKTGTLAAAGIDD
jgi:hypothetical protein